jgi:hypothetical protein
MKKILPVYTYFFLIFSLLFFLLLRLPIFQIGVLFYRGIILLILTAVVSFSVFSFLNRKFFRLSWETIIACLILSFSLHLSFFVIFPVTFERSVTMYLLEKIASGEELKTKNQCLSKQTLNQFLMEEYILKNKAIDKRIKEQEIAGFLKATNNCVRMPPKGRFFLRVVKIIKKVYAIR